MAGTVTLVDTPVRRMMAQMIAESEGKKRNPYVTKFLKFKKKTLGDPWRDKKVTDADGKSDKWKDLTDEYIRAKFGIKKYPGKIYRSPYGKPIQAPWDFERGYMRKVPKSDYIKVPESQKRASILVKTHSLKNSIVAKKSFARGKIQFVITVKGPARAYGWYHMYGAPNRKSRNGSPNPLPARPFMVWTRADIRALEDILYAWAAAHGR
ncbi:MAG TPA: hypothetical protein VM223_24430 [Planctomycetota bacterium]|nr:hypothetical protein [Planctomycetota bacterium]